MEPWYKVATPRKEVREVRSFDPSEFVIALEQVVSGLAAGAETRAVGSCWLKAGGEFTPWSLESH